MMKNFNIITPYHAKYFAHELTKRCSSDNIEKLAGALVDAQVDLNPHQVDAALFAFDSPLSKGAILADEVGLGVLLEGPDNYCHARYRVWQKSQITQMPTAYAGTSAQICVICG